MVWKFCGKAQFPHSFGRKLCLSTKFPHQEIRWNCSSFFWVTYFPLGISNIDKAKIHKSSGNISFKLYCRYKSTYIAAKGFSLEITVVYTHQSITCRYIEPNPNPKSSMLKTPSRLLLLFLSFYLEKGFLSHNNFSLEDDKFFRSRHLQDVFKTCLEDAFKTYSRPTTCLLS